jgi:hypothetical protein
MVKGPYWQIMTIYVMPFLVSQPLSSTHTPKIIKTGFLSLNTDVFPDKDIASYGVTNIPLEDNKNLDNCRL